MKNFRLAIIFLVSVIFLSGCGSDQYTLEREQWQARRMARNIFKNPHATPPKELERVVKFYDDFINKFPKTNFTADSEFTIVRLYLVKEDYDKARARLGALQEKYKDSEILSAEINYLIGYSYEQAKNWDTALKYYKKTQDEYPFTVRGLDMPAYIAAYYKTNYQPDKMIAAYQEAIKHYKKLGATHTNTLLGLKANTMISQCYIELKEWQKAIDNLEHIIELYKEVMPVDGVLLDIALIYDKELKNRVKAKEVLERLVKDYPNSKIIKTATELLKEWKK